MHKRKAGRFLTYRNISGMFQRLMKIQISACLLKDRKTFLIINSIIGVLIIVAILLLVRDAISLFAPVKTKSMKPEKKAPAIVRHSLQDYAVILKNNPFGFPGGELTLLSASTSGAPQQSKSDYSLIGTIAGPKEVSYAIFMDKTGHQDIFKAGTQVFGLGTLKTVEKTRVLINSGGKEIEIPLADYTNIKEIKAGAPSQSQFGKKTGESSYAIDQQRVQQAIDKPDQIMTDARFTPNIVDGKQQGFVLSEVKPGGIYGSLGLQNGDVLLRINEFSISNPETALQAFTALRGIDRAQLDVIRSGAKMTMTYSIR